MKPKLLPALILFTLAQAPFNVFAQCNPSIPNTSNVVSTTQTVNGGFTPQWVCAGDTLFSDGGIFFVYLEAGAVMNTGGGIDSIYVKDGATLNMNGGIHVILHEPSAILNILGGAPTYYPCSLITFDYSNAPAGGCFITSALENMDIMSFSIFPNPVANELRIQNAELRIEEIEIYSVFGELIFIQPQTSNLKPQTVDVSQLSSGIYFVKMKTEKGISTAKFVKE